VSALRFTVTDYAVTPFRAARDHPLTPVARWCVGVAGAALCGFAVTLVATGSRRDQVDQAVAEALIVGVPIAVGLWASRSPRNVRFGALLIGTGAVWSLTALGESSQSVPYSIGRVAAWLIFPVLMYLMLAYPEGRLRPGLDRRLYGSLVLLVTLLFIGSALFVEAYPAGTPWTTCDTDCPANAFLVLDSEPGVMDSVIRPVRELLAVVVLTGIAGTLAVRWRATTPLQRLLIGPLMAMSIVSIGILAGYLIVRRLEPDSAAIGTLGRLWSLCLPAIAAAFFIGLLWRRLAIGDVLKSLTAALGHDLDAGRLRTALAVALRDPTVDVLYPDDAPGSWRDTDGRSTSRSAVIARGRAVTTIEDEGVPIAALAHDPALREDEDLLEVIGSVVRAALRHERLTTRLETSLDLLEDSRKRIASSADAERSRIERDLHDGAQQRLIAVRIKLSLAEELIGTDPAAGAAVLAELGDDIERALEELRALGHGLYPSLLSGRGLPDALRSVLAEAPLRGHLQTGGVTRHSREIESAVYFACREAIQNASKHAGGATGLWVTLNQNDALRFEVRDDGPGFVPPGDEADGGLRNMRDRLETVGGRLTIDSAPGHGTRVRGVVPLA
jgi:signal transduction histidine kinase